MSHWGILVLLAALVSLAFSFLMRETPKERLIFGIKMFLGFVAFTLIAGWIAIFIP
ncbi:MAG TPA: hypothetical protein VMX35_01625 [Acidobacteriota bacterium]|nr:hypothetical protein [Acidobacteriota bacterium]